jgi:hypothetical protein
LPQADTEFHAVGLNSGRTYDSYKLDLVSDVAERLPRDAIRVAMLSHADFAFEEKLPAKRDVFATFKQKEYKNVVTTRATCTSSRLVAGCQWP